MNFEDLIFLMVMLVLILIPIVIINRKKKKREKQFLQSLFGLAEKSDCKITSYDRWSDTAIGIDKPSKKIFFFRKSSKNELGTEVDLLQVRKCRFVNTHRIVSLNESQHKVIEKLELVFAFTDVRIPEQTLEFYNAQYDSLSLRGEIQLGEKWEDIVNSTIGLGQL